MQDNEGGVFARQQHGGDARQCRCRSRAMARCCCEVKASTICGSDIRCIYHEHLGKGPEGYQGVIAGHEPCGQMVEAGPGCRRFKAGDRVIVYHISGCGVCNDCRRGYMISCTSEKYRRAYGWQRDGGMAELHDRRREGSDCPARCAHLSPTARRWRADSARSTRGWRRSASAAIMPC